MRWKAIRRHLPAYLFVAPALLALVVFVFVPMGAGFVLSFASWNIVRPLRWIGFRNYALALADPTFALALVNTLVYTLISSTLGIAGALVMAVALNRRIPGIGAFRALLFLPALMSEVIVAMVFQWLYNSDTGLINYGLSLLHLPAIPWLTSTTWAMPAVVLMGAWVGVAYNTPILLTGLQSINPNLGEAARIDGASRWQEFRHVTLPMLRPFTLYVWVMALIGSFQMFGRVYMLTGGGPVNSTLLAVQYIYRVAFTFDQIGYASALSAVLFLILLVATVAQIRWLQPKEAA